MKTEKRIPIVSVYLIKRRTRHLIAKDYNLTPLYKLAKEKGIPPRQLIKETIENTEKQLAFLKETYMELLRAERQKQKKTG